LVPYVQHAALVVVDHPHSRQVLYIHVYIHIHFRQPLIHIYSREREKDRETEREVSSLPLSPNKWIKRLTRNSN